MKLHSDCVETLEVCHVVCLQAVKSNAIEYRRCQKVSSSSILQTPVWSKLHISSHRRMILWIDKQRGRSSIKVAKWYQSFWVVSFCYHHHHHLFLRLTDTTKDRNYVWAMSHEFTWETQGSLKGHQQIWEGPCVCIKMMQGNFFGPSLKMEITDAQTGTVWHNLLFGKVTLLTSWCYEFRKCSSLTCFLLPESWYGSHVCANPNFKKKSTRYYYEAVSARHWWRAKWS
jgi:hypothetical protein